MQNRVIKGPDDIPITPAHIDTSRDFMGAFDNMETETSARWIVRLCQDLGGWVPFTLDQLQELYTRRLGHQERFWFNRLVDAQMVRRDPWSEPAPCGGGWVVIKDGKYHVTDDFVLRCYRSAPMEDTANG